MRKRRFARDRCSRSWPPAAVGGDSSQATEGGGTTDTDAAEITAGDTGSTSDTALPTSSAGAGHEPLAEVLGAALLVSVNGPDFDAEPACFEAAVDGASPAAKESPVGWKRGRQHGPI